LSAGIAPVGITAPSIPSAAKSADIVTGSLAARFLAALGRETDEGAEGKAAPLGLHWCLAPEVPGAGDLLPDGIPAGGIMPTLDLPRRVWAGGTVRFHAPLRIGDRVERRSRVLDVDRKTGRSGPVAFVQIEHLFTVDGRPHVADLQTIAYRAAAPEGEARPVPHPPATDPPGRLLRQVTTDPAMLFRFSAVTFNAHRIHYDRGYTEEVEGYPGLLVHGPLTASLLLDTAAAKFGAGRIGSASFRAAAPAICGQTLTIHLSHPPNNPVLRASVDGSPVMTMELRFREPF
jgi:3-methylfumaryl-CoA hydratase